MRYMVKLKADNRWLADTDRDGSSVWTTARGSANRYACKSRAYAAAMKPEMLSDFNAGKIVIVRVRRVKRKTIPVPKVEIQLPTCPGDTFGVTINGVAVRTHIDTLSRAEAAANALRRALGIPEST